MGWSDLPSDPVISIAARLEEPRDFVRFRTVCRSWESAVRGFRPSFFPWLAVIPDLCDPNQDEMSFISMHAGSNDDCIYKCRIAMLCRGGGNIIFYRSRFSSSSEDGWMVSVRWDDGVPIIVNPLTGTQLIQPLPSLYTLCKHRGRIESIVFLPDNNVVIVGYRLEEDYHVLVAATPGDDEWSATHVPESLLNSNIAFHEADSKFYIMNRLSGTMHSFRLIRCGGRKTNFSQVSSALATATRREYLFFDSRLMSDGTRLLQVRKYFPSTKFDILKYSPDADMWVKMTAMDFGYNALFFDRYGVRMLPLPYQRDEEGRPGRNCIYFTNYEIKNGQYFHYVGLYDMEKGTMDPYFSTINGRLNRNFSQTFMWFTPSLSINN